MKMVKSSTQASPLAFFDATKFFPFQIFDNCELFFFFFSVWSELTFSLSLFPSVCLLDWLRVAAVDYIHYSTWLGAIWPMGCIALLVRWRGPMEESVCDGSSC